MSRLAALVALGTLVVVGCASAPRDGGEASTSGASQDELGLRKGSVDQAGIVEASTMMLAADPTSHELDPYNEEDPFRITGSYADTFSQRLQMFDGIDGKEDWDVGASAAWVTRMSTGNYLVVDTSKPCGDFDHPRTYLEIERAAMTGGEHATCGGRMPNEDALDVTMAFLVGGPSASVDDDDALHDGVDQATHRATATFPFLAEMNGF